MSHISINGIFPPLLSMFTNADLGTMAKVSKAWLGAVRTYEWQVITRTSDCQAIRIRVEVRIAHFLHPEERKILRKVKDKSAIILGGAARVVHAIGESKEVAKTTPIILIRDFQEVFSKNSERYQYPISERRKSALMDAIEHDNNSLVYLLIEFSRLPRDERFRFLEVAAVLNNHELVNLLFTSIADDESEVREMSRVFDINCSTRGRSLIFAIKNDRPKLVKRVFASGRIDEASRGQALVLASEKNDDALVGLLLQSGDCSQESIQAAFAQAEIHNNQNIMNLLISLLPELKDWVILTRV